MFIFGGGSSSDYNYLIEKSLRFRGAVTAYLDRTTGTSTSQFIWTYSTWVKKTTNGVAQDPRGGAVDSSNYGGIRFDASDRLQIYRVVGGASTTYRLSTRVFRDPSAWYHVVVRYDAPNATAADRIKVWVNGEEITVWTTNVAPAVGDTLYINRNSTSQRVGMTLSSSNFDGYIAECHHIDGQALSASDFGEISSVTNAWVPKAYTGTYGTSGFYLGFDNGTNLTTLCEDQSPNSNDFTANAISLTAGVTYDWMSDTPTNNYPTFNQLKVFGTAMTYSNCALNVNYASNNSVGAIATMRLPTSGKFYWEVVATTISSTFGFIGVAPDSNVDSNSAPTVGYYRSNGTIANLAGTLQTAGATYTTNDVIGIAVDIDAGTVQFYKNNAAQGASPSFTFTAGTSLTPHVCGDNVVGTKSFTINFGQQPFTYTAPSGYLPLCSQNLPSPAIKRGDNHFKARTRTGTGSYPLSVTGERFSPDLVWFKSRVVTYSHVLYDAVRGTGITKSLSSNVTNGEGFYSTNANLSSFNSDGFTIGSTSGTDILNGAGITMVDWMWNESSTSGFGIVAYTGNGANRTIAHNLGVAPKFVITKRLDAASSWQVGHDTVGWGSYLILESTAAPTANATAWNSTAPTSSVFSLGTGTIANTNLGLYVAYLFAEVAGFSEIGGYTGTGTVDGPFVWCGFRPAFVLIKRTSAAGDDWYIYDNARDPYNATTRELNPDTNAAETTTRTLDLLANGFKIRTTASGMNAAAGTYVFIAFAENPFKYSNAR